MSEVVYIFVWGHFYIWEDVCSDRQLFLFVPFLFVSSILWVLFDLLAIFQNSDASTDWEGSDDPDYGSKKKPVVVKIKKEPRGSSSRNRKRPSFFQEFENEENNLDKILDDFEQEQVWV